MFKNDPLFVVQTLTLVARCVNWISTQQISWKTSQIKEVACMVHIRRKVLDVFKSQGSYVAKQAIQRIT
jgi:hypothetical protein